MSGRFIGINGESLSVSPALGDTTLAPFQISMADIQKAWSLYTTTVKKCPPDIPHSSILLALQLAGRARSVSLWTLHYFLQQLSKTIPKLLEEASKLPSPDSDQVAQFISTAHEQYSYALKTLVNLETHFPQTPTLSGRFIHRLRANLDSAVKPKFSLAVYHFFESHLLTSESRSQVPARPPLVAQLPDLGFSQLAEDALSWAVFERMDALVASKVSPSVRAIPELLHWVHRFAAPCVSALLPANRPVSDTNLWLKRLVFHLHESVCTIRTKQILVLIEQFPKSMPALRDLRDCILCTDRKPVVATALRDQFVAKLLNAGTFTADILQQYVSTIRTLRFLDPSGVVLACVSGPIRTYLRRRPDTVRCIVSGMTGDGDLYEELQRGRLDIGENREIDNDGDVNMLLSTGPDISFGHAEDDDCQSIDGDLDARMRTNFEDYNRWMPDPIDAPVREGKWKPGGDAIATLVNIYGSSEQIVSEYRGLLADKIVSSFEFDLKREERILELLIERFGKDAMHNCSIMLKDVRDSKLALGVAQGIHDGMRGELDKFEATVISKEFWPNLVEEGGFRATNEMERQMAFFENSFEKTKAPRKLRWQHGLGNVEVKLEFDDGRQVVTNVTPMQATILSYFGQKRRIRLKDLMCDMNISNESLLLRKVQVLANLGFLRAVDGHHEEYETVEDATGCDGAVDDGQVDGDDGAEEEAKEDAEMAVYETYIMAMLQNLKQLSLEQIHGMLRRFVQTPAYDKTQTQLAAFLSALVNKGKVEVAAGIYRVKK